MHSEILIKYLSLFIWGKLSENNQRVIYERKLNFFFITSAFILSPKHFFQRDGEGIKLLGEKFIFNGSYLGEGLIIIYNFMNKRNKTH